MSWSRVVMWLFKMLCLYVGNKQGVLVSMVAYGIIGCPTRYLRLRLVN